MKTFTVDNLPGDLEWKTYRKVALTQIARVDGPFAVQIDGQGPDSVVTCEDGYVGLDARGYPYPLAADELPLIYVPAERPLIYEEA